MQIDELIERLERMETAGPNASGVYLNWPTNPDGPQAAQALRDLKASADALAGALRPFASHVDKDGEEIILKWGASTYTGTLKPNQFYAASQALAAYRDLSQ